MELSPLAEEDEGWVFGGREVFFQDLSPPQLTPLFSDFLMLS